MPQIEFFGFGSICNINKILGFEKPKKVFLVTGKSSYEFCKAKPALESRLSFPFKRFCDFSPNPQLEEIQRGYEQFKQKDYGLLIGIGGGSAIDVAKAIKLSYFNDTGLKIPLVAIPTTAGSGSEATHFIVCYQGKEKQSKGNPEITLPDYSIIDPNFILKLPKKISAETGLDALSQAIESYWSIDSTPESQNYARNAIKLLRDNLEDSVNNPNNHSRQAVMKAANLAGKAINISRTTACHSIAYPLTSYFEIAHGHAAALTLGQMLLFNSQISETDCSDKRGAKYVRKTINEITHSLGFSKPEQANQYLSQLIKNLGLKTRLSELGIDKKGIEIIVKNGFTAERVKNNPRVLTKENLREILEKID